jgi:hypothetical protein
MTAPADVRTTTINLIAGCWSTQAIYTAVRLGIPDRIAANPQTAADLAHAVGSHEGGTFRLMRALAVLGLVRQLDGERFDLTQTGELLRTDVPNSLAPVSRHWGTRAWRSFANLEHAVRTGEPVKDSGREGFQSLEHRPEDAAVFNETMAAQTEAVAPAILDAYDFSKFCSVVDLGGGYGALVAALLRKYPQLEGACADLAYIQPNALRYFERAGVADRARFIPTEFFSSVEAGADCYLLKFIIHDWNDADSIAILRNTCTAAGANGVVLLVEQVAPERATTEPQHVAAIRTDVQMLAGVGGMERTVPEYRALLKISGLQLTRVVPTGSSFSVIEAVRA